MCILRREAHIIGSSNNQCRIFDFAQTVTAAFPFVNIHGLLMVSGGMLPSGLKILLLYALGCFGANREGRKCAVLINFIPLFSLGEPDISVNF